MGNIQPGHTVTPLNGSMTAEGSHSVPPVTCPDPSASLCSALLFPQPLKNLQINFIPSQLTWLLAHISPQRTRPLDHPGFTLHAVARLHWPGLQHYYGIICHLTPLRLALDLSLNLPIHDRWNGIRLPRLRRTPCEQ